MHSNVKKITMASSVSSTSICPFTLKSIADIKQEDLAVICNANPLLRNDPSPDETDKSAEAQIVECGHSCTMVNLVSYLHDEGGAKLCPVCQSPVSVICDSSSSNFLAQPSPQNDARKCPDSNEGRIIFFRYGTIIYFLQSPPRLSPSKYKNMFRNRNRNSLDRIGSVLGMDVKSGLTVSDLIVTEKNLVCDWLIFCLVRLHSGHLQRKGHSSCQGK